MFPAIPDWESLHPIVVHFPIALLLIAPIFVAIGAASRRARAFSLSALILMVIGTGALFLAMATGEAAEDQVAPGAPGATTALEHHEELAAAARIAFSILTGVFGVLIAAAVALGDRLKRPAIVAAHVIPCSLRGGVPAPGQCGARGWPTGARVRRAGSTRKGAPCSALGATTTGRRGRRLTGPYSRDQVGASACGSRHEPETPSPG